MQTANKHRKSPLASLEATVSHCLVPRRMATVENELVTVTIVRYGHPVAQIVPIARHNRTKTDPLLSRIVIKGDPCENDADDWENA